MLRIEIENLKPKKAKLIKRKLGSENNTLYRQKLFNKSYD